MYIYNIVSRNVMTVAEFYQIRHRIYTVNRDFSFLFAHDV